jgi:hypothetical protein
MDIVVYRTWFLKFYEKKLISFYFALLLQYFLNQSELFMMYSQFAHCDFGIVVGAITEMSRKDQTERHNQN